MSNLLYRVRAVFAPGRRVTERSYFTASVAAARMAAASEGAVDIFEIKPYRRSWLTQEYLGPTYALQFLQALRFQISAGVPPGRAIQTAVEAEPDAERQARLHSAIDVLDRGGSVADALMATGMYDSTAYALLAAGERIGALQAIGGALTYMEDRKSGWKQLAAIAGLLGIELSTALSVPLTIHNYAIPWVRDHPPKSSAETIASFGERLAHIECINFVWMVASYMTTAVLVAVLAAWFASPRARDWLAARLVGRLPLVSSWMEHDALARSGQMFATLLENGVRAVDAVETLRRSSVNPVVARLWSGIAMAIGGGASIGKALAASGVLRSDEALAASATQGMAQLARAFRSIAENRAWLAKRTATAITEVTVGLTIAYIGVNLLLVTELFKLFNEGLDMSMSGFMQGF